MTETPKPKPNAMLDKDRELTSEELAEIVDNSVYGTSTWINGRSRQAGSLPAESMVPRPIDRKLAAEFLDKGILERLQVARSDIPFARINPQSDKGEEPSVGLIYSTLNNGDAYTKTRTRYGSVTRGATGNFFAFNVFLPQSDAERLLSGLQDNPQIVRQLGDMLMQKDYSQEDWGKIKPPWEAWREMNGNVERLAIVHDGYDGPGEAEVIDF